MTWTWTGDPATPDTPADRDPLAYVRERYGRPQNVRGFQYADADRAQVLAARLSHVHWAASRLLAGAKALLTQAQLREEELIENLVSAKNSCDETVAPAEAVLAAAQLVEELEQHIETIARICDETRPGTVEGGDDQ